MFSIQVSDIKKVLESMRCNGLIEGWHLPSEDRMLKLEDAVFFLSPANKEVEKNIWIVLSRYDHFSFRLNLQREISEFRYRVTFNRADKEINLGY